MPENLLAWAKLPSPLPRFNEPEATEEVVECANEECAAAEDVAPADTVIVQ